MATTRVCTKLRQSYDIDCRRPGMWGNPFIVGVHGSHAVCVLKFREWFLAQPAFVAAAIVEMEGKRLACACRPGQLCHVEIYIEACDGSSPFFEKWKALEEAHRKFFEVLFR